MYKNKQLNRPPFGNRTNVESRFKYEGKQTRSYNTENDIQRSQKRLRYDLQDSPKSKSQLREQMKFIKINETKQFSYLLQQSSARLKQVSKKVHWKIFAELADVAKRENQIQVARALFTLSCWLQPYAQQTWLEYSKLEEESGRLEKAKMLLLLGIQFQPLSDQLVIKFLKTEEKLGNCSVARCILHSLRNFNLEKTWKIILEGGLMEIRQGNVQIGLKIVETLLQQCGQIGAIYLEVVRMEERWGGNLNLAMSQCEQGLARNGRYGPLWFCYLRLLEKLEQKNPQLKEKRVQAVNQAASMLSKELIWKLYLELAMSFDRNDEEKQEIIQCVKLSAQVAPDNLLWKIWLVASRIELRLENVKNSKTLLKKSLQLVPQKQKSIVLLELSRLYEYLGSISKARRVIQQACDNTKQDWKVYLEYITMEMRQSNFSVALRIAKESLIQFPATGRLWAALIQLQHTQQDLIENDIPMKSFILALQEVPKSGEVWCEGARLRMNPYSRHFNLKLAEKYLNYAIQFTPQYGDSFIEMLRLYLLKQKWHKIAELKCQCINADPNYGMLWFYCKKSILDNPKTIWKAIKLMVLQDLSVYRNIYKSVNLQIEFSGQMWTGIQEVNQAYLEINKLDEKGRWRLIFGSEAISL